MSKQDTGQGLGAVMVANIVNASRVMGVDETGIHVRLGDSRSADIRSMFEAYNGRTVRAGSDNSRLVAFANVGDALACAIEVQQTLSQRNEDLPEYQKIFYRIGINLGDIDDNQVIYGDNVVAATQISSLADVGGICISGKVRDALGDGFALDCQEIDAKQLESNPNLDQVYRVQLPEDTGDETKVTNSSATLWLAGLVVLIFIIVVSVIFIR